jgi:hypothetical protein
VYDVLGKEVGLLVKERLPAGDHSAFFYKDELPSGLYFYRLNTGSIVATKKMILAK